jgi:cold shock CspA family protein
LGEQGLDERPPTTLRGHWLRISIRKGGRVRVGAKKRVALKPHMERIREWTDGGKTDEWIASALGTSAPSVQSFRSRHGILRGPRAEVRRGPRSAFEAVLDHGEREGWGLRLDPRVAEDPVWSEHWANVEALVVRVSASSIVLEPDPSASSRPAEDVGDVAATAQPGRYCQAGHDGAGGTRAVEKGRVKWFDPDKGYGFLSRPSGEDLFVHRSEVEGDPAALEPGGEVEYEVGLDDRGPVALGVRMRREPTGPARPSAKACKRS